MKGAFLTVFFVFVQNYLFGQYRFSYLDIDDGLIENSVNDIFQDSEGYLWFATQDGISRYDGYTFKNYTFFGEDEKSLSDNFLWGIQEDSLGFIWACSRNGLNRIDKKTGNCTRFFRNPNSGILGGNQTTSQQIYGKKNYVIFSDKLYQIDISNSYKNTDITLNKNRRVDNIKEVLFGFVKDDFGDRLYGISEKGLINIQDTSRIEFPKGTKPQKRNFYSNAQDSKGTLWITNTTELFFLTMGSDKLEKWEYDFDNASIGDITFSADEMWIATTKGLVVFKDGKFHKRVVKGIKDQQGLSSSYCSSLSLDRTGKMWIGTAGNGINIYDPKKDQFKFLGSTFFGNDYIVRGIAEDKKDRLFISTDVGLFYSEYVKKDLLTAFQFIGDALSSPRSVQPDLLLGKTTKIGIAPNNDIIVGTTGLDLIILDQNLQLKKEVLLNKEHQKTNVVSDVLITNNSIWVASYWGVYQLDFNYEVINDYRPDNESGLQTNYFLKVSEDADNRIWVGSNRGISYLDTNENKFINLNYNPKDLSQSPGFNFISGFVDLGDGNLWISTYGGGVSKFDKKQKVFTHFILENGLPNNVCNGILADSEQNLWISTNRGISKLNTTNETITNYYTEDGLHSKEFNLNANYKNDHDELFFGTSKGVVCFNPKDIIEDEYIPQIAITGLDINYKSELERLKNNSLIDLYPEDKTITIHFAGFNYSSSSNVSYKYQLEGYHEDWIVEKKGNLHTTYTNLSAGEYTFKVMCSNTSGIFSGRPKEFKIRVHPPFYKTGWFITLVIIVSIAIVVLSVRFFYQQKLKKEYRALEIKQKIQDEKERISRELHDNIGAQMTYLISSIDYEGYKAKDQSKFDELGDKARNVMTMLRQTIWIMNKEEILGQELKQKIQDYLMKMFGPLPIQSHTEYECDQEVKIPPTMVNNLFRIVQETVNNTIKHSQASTFTLLLKIEKDYIYIVANDDGKGIGEIADLNDHFGLRNMHTRARELGGTMVIKSGRGVKGTTLEFSIPLQN